MRVLLMLLRAVLGLGRFLRDVLFGGFLIVFLIGLGVLGYQGYSWLRHAQWPAMPLSLLFDAVAPLNQWLKDPQSWYGLHKLVSGTLAFLPLSFFLLAFSFLVICLLECLEAPRQRSRAMWQFVNTPAVLMLLFALFVVGLAHTWQTRQATRESYRDTRRYTLEALHRLSTVAENLPLHTQIEARQLSRVWEALRGESTTGLWAGFSPLFAEFKAAPLEQLLYHLSLRLPQERQPLHQVRGTVKNLETWLASDIRPGGELTATQQQRLEALHTRLRHALSVLEGFLGR